MMLKKVSIVSVVLAAALSALAVQGCRTGYDSEPDLPEQGAMSKETADLIFEYKEIVEGGVRIDKFINAAVLGEYLAGNTANTRQVAPLDEPELPKFIIKTIDRQPVTRIAPDAFSPAAGAPNIGTAVSSIELPETIVELGDNLFNGMETPIFLDIPEEVVDVMRDAYLDEIRADAGNAAAEEAGEDPEILTKVFERVLAGSAVAVRQISPDGEEPEIIAAGPLADLEETEDPGEPEEPSTPSRPYVPSTPPPSVSYRIGPNAITGLAPVPMGKPVLTVSGPGYSGRVAWSSNAPGWTSESFEPNYSYTAVITIVSWPGYVLSSVDDNPVSGANTTSIGSPSGAGAVITAEFYLGRDANAL